MWESAANVDPAGQNLQSFSGQWRRLGEPEKPEAIGMNSTEELIVTSLHWAHTPKYGLILVATYMYHGVMYVVQTVYYVFFRGSIHYHLYTGSIKQPETSNESVQTTSQD